VDRQEVGSVADLKKLLTAAEDGGVLLLIRRGDSTLFVAMKEREQ